MITVSQIVKHVGSVAIQDACSVSEYSVRAAKRDNSFPASWFHAVERLCIEKGLECPRSLFNFKGSLDE